jgi:hypothetical protein
MLIYNVITAISGGYPDIASHPEKYFFRKKTNIFHQHFLPNGRADLTASTSLQPIRSSVLQLHGLLLRHCSNLDP